LPDTGLGEIVIPGMARLPRNMVDAVFEFVHRLLGDLIVGIPTFICLSNVIKSNIGVVKGGLQVIERVP
jgi:hypothetical protein